jgi:taurine dioxygenase
MYKAYEELSPDIKAEVEGKTAIFGSGHNLMKRCKDRGYDLHIPESDIKPDVEHPVIINHPVTNKKSIFVNWTHTDLIKGMAQEKSDSLLNHIYEHCKCSEFTYSHHYKEGDLIVWDNASTLHTGPTGVTEEPRIMRRTVVKGSKPVFIA